MRRTSQLILLILFAAQNLKGQNAIVCGKIVGLPDTSYIKCSFISNNLLEPVKAVTIQVTNGEFYQQLEVKSPIFLSFAEGNNYYCGFIQSGDSIQISYAAGNMKNTIRFKGKGNMNFSIPNRINELNSILGTSSQAAKEKQWPAGWFLQKTDSAGKRILNDIRKAMTADKSVLVGQLESYLEATLLNIRYNGIQIIAGDHTYNELLNSQTSLRPTDKARLKKLLQFNAQYAGSVFYQRSVYRTLLIQYESDVQKAMQDPTLIAKYDYLQRNLPEKLRSPVCYLFISKEIGVSANDEIETLIKSIYPENLVENFRNTLLKKVAVSRGLYEGAPAPDFIAEDLNGNTISLASLKGKVVYMDFWFAACTPCHRLFSETQSVKDHFRSDSNVVFLNISIDNLADWQNAVQKYRISGLHVFTEDRLRDHPAIRNYNVQEYPTTYLINRNGTIANTAPSHLASELITEIETALQQN